MGLSFFYLFIFLLIQCLRSLSKSFAVLYALFPFAAFGRYILQEAFSTLWQKR
ncbi:MAG: hypothetical protein RHS_3678 [Robinsoniella sp. RHS]|nr:MAG: hypothetical protein RHS_3678 [Robinsoniella sp. RHS]